MDTSTSSVKFTEHSTTTSSIYKKRPPTPTRKKFELGDLDTDTSTKSSRLNPEVTREEGALKDELLRIFGREKDAMESHYLNKIQELLRSFKSKKLEWEEMVRAEREDLERQFESERTDINQSFAQEISKISSRFQEEKNDIARKMDNRIRDRETEMDREKRDLTDNWRTQVEAMRKECQSNFEMKLEGEIKKEKDKHTAEMQLLEKKLEHAQFSLEKSHERELNEMEAKHDKIVYEIEKKREEEKDKLEKEWQRKVDNLEDALRKETNYRNETEKLASHEKENLKTINGMLKEELIRMKEECERVRRQQQEMKAMEKQQAPLLQSFTTRADLPAALRDDFDRIVTEYKTTLKERFADERQSLEEKMELERERMKEKMSREREELDKKLNEEKFRMERDLDRSKDDIEKEIERRLRSKQLSETLLAQQQRFDEVARRLEEEEKNRYERLKDGEFRKFESQIGDLQRENDGLKAKIQLLVDNNKVLKSLKEEGQQEVERLRRAVEDLKTVMEARKETDRTRAHTPAEFTPFLMSMMQQNQQNHSQHNQTQDEPISQKSQLDELYHERRKLEDLKNDLRKQERDIRERRTMEDAAKMAANQSHEKYEGLLEEKRRLERQLQTLEQRVVNMQEEFTKLRTQQQQQHQQQQQPLGPQQIVLQAPPSPSKEPKDQIQPVNVFNIPPSNNSAPSQSTPNGGSATQMAHPFFYPHPPMFSPNDQTEKISKLKATKERLTSKLEELQRELRDANQENSMLQKQCQDYERRIDKLSTALEKEQEMTGNLKDILNEEKMRVNKLKDDLERESENVVRARTETEEIRSHLQQDIQELQNKLQVAEITLATSRQQPQQQQLQQQLPQQLQIQSNEMKPPLPPQQQQPQQQPIGTNIQLPYPMQPNEQQVGMVTLPSMPQMFSQQQPQMLPPQQHVAPYYAVNAARRRLSLSKTADSYTQAELEQVRSLEEEKYRLQRELQDTKGALDAYNTKFRQQVNPEPPMCHFRNRSNSMEMVDASKVLATSATSTMGKKHLRTQKLQLQKLIERLTHLGPTPLAPMPHGY